MSAEEREAMLTEFAGLATRLASLSNARAEGEPPSAEEAAILKRLNELEYQIRMHDLKHSGGAAEPEWPSPEL